MRISDWSSDVCSSDLRIARTALGRPRVDTAGHRGDIAAGDADVVELAIGHAAQHVDGAAVLEVTRDFGRSGLRQVAQRDSAIDDGVRYGLSAHGFGAGVRIPDVLILARVHGLSH